MHRDMKVGLSLGVFLVGVVGALFFRREPEKKPVSPQLQNTSQLDQQIAEKARGPYLSQPEEFLDSKPATVAKTSEKSNRTAATLSLEDEGQPQGSANNRGGSSGSNHVASTVPPPLSANAEWEAVGTPGPIAAATPSTNNRNVPVARTATVAETTRTHVVQAGETLSGLAGKYLGSTARYREIYDANRDVLRSPNSLTEGLTLKIPAKSARRGAGDTHPAIAGQTPSSRTPAAENMTRPVSQQLDRSPATTDVGENVSSPAPASERPVPRFTPVRRSPFAAGRNTQPAAVTVPEAASVPAAESDE